MHYKIISKKDLATTTWQGGTTTQLYIYPENASYLERNFDFRISTAKVESKISQFTSLPNVHRKLMVLDGSIIINHEGRYSKKLTKFEIDTFEGNWKTSGIGTCTDFNLMSTKNQNGSIEAFPIEKNEEVLISKKTLSKWLILYVFTGEINLKLKHERVKLQQGSVLIMEDISEKTISIIGIERSELIATTI
uniref:HutD family protein n=1 Tax=Flavobacterium sp. TaxID=239 RepID=UPI0040493A89